MIAIHKNTNQVATLLEMMDCEENDFIIHIDAKSKDIDEERLRASVKYGRLFFSDRVDVKWGDISIVEATILMMKEALKVGHHSFYHLISGQDLPLKNIRSINKYFDDNGENVNYVAISNKNWIQRIIRYRRFYNLYEKIGNSIFVQKVFRKIAMMIGGNIFAPISSKMIGYSAGPAWFDINEATALKIVDNETWIYRHFRYDVLPDEAFIQTVF